MRGMVILALALLGLCFGSFVNALVWRLHKQETGKKQKAKSKEADLYSITKGRSICPHCEHILAVKDLIPVLSWLLLKGKCRYCKKPISYQYPLVEASTVALFVISYVFWPEPFSFIEIIDFSVWLACLVGLIALLVYDLRWMLLPNKIIFPLSGLAIINILLQSILTTNYELLTAAALAAFIGGGIFYVLFQISDGKWIGGGDVKLGFLLGILVSGPLPALLLIFIASFLGSVISIPLLATQRVSHKTRIPFGPFLIIACITVRLFSERIIDLYNQTLIL